MKHIFFAFGIFFLFSCSENELLDKTTLEGQQELSVIDNPEYKFLYLNSYIVVHVNPEILKSEKQKFTNLGFPEDTIKINNTYDSKTGLIKVEVSPYPTYDPYSSTSDLEQNNNANFKATGDLYRVHVQDLGWQPWVANGVWTGTSGRSLGIEAFEMKEQPTVWYGPQWIFRYRASRFDNPLPIEVCDWKWDGQMMGSTGEDKSLDIIQFESNEHYRTGMGIMTYSVHQQSYGDKLEIPDGNKWGTHQKRIEKIRINIYNW